MRNYALNKGDNMQRFNTNTPILNPVDAVAPIATVSERYGFASSREILSVFEGQGWQVESTGYAKVKNAERAGFQKHLIWLTHPDFQDVPGLSINNRSQLRMCFLNSHDMTSSLQAFLGLMRTACLNQLLTGSIFRTFRAVHSRSIISKLNAGIKFVTDGIPELIDNVQRLQRTQLSLGQRMELARLVLPERFANVNGLISYDASVVERAMRSQDTEQDAYTVSNRLQEYLIRGGVPYSYNRNVYDKANPDLVIGSKVVHTHTRKVGSIATQIRFNEALFNGIKTVAQVA